MKETTKVPEGLTAAQCLEGMYDMINRAKTGERLIYIAKHEGLDMEEHLVEWVEEIGRDDIKNSLDLAIDYFIEHKQRATGAK